MSSRARSRRRRPLPELLAVVLAAALLAVSVLARAQTPGTTSHPPGHTATDTTTPQAERDAWEPPRKAKEIRDHAKAARERADDLKTRLDGGWCPSTREEWTQALDGLACFLTMQHLWKGHIKKGPLKAQFDGTPLGKDADDAFDGYKGLRDGLLAKLQACDTTNAPTAEGVTVEGIPVTGVYAYALRRAAEKMTLEWRSFGLAEVALVNCREPEKCPKLLVTGGGK
jgi:hypothetical protein